MVGGVSLVMLEAEAPESGSLTGSWLTLLHGYTMMEASGLRMR